MVEQLGGIDAAFVELESATGHLQGLGIARLDPGSHPISRAELIELIGRRLPQLELLRRQLVTVPGGVDRPYWVEVVPDLDVHVRAVDLPAGATEADFEAFCAELAGTKLDRSRPMWEFWLLSGLPGGAQALAIKVHHALCDGVGSLALVAQLFDLTPEPPDTAPTDTDSTDTDSTDTDSTDTDSTDTGPTDAATADASSTDATSTDAAAAEGAADEEPPGAPWLLAHAAIHAVQRSVEAVATMIELVGSVHRLREVLDSVGDLDLAAPLATPHLPFHGRVSAHRSVAFRELPLDRIKAVAHASGTHVNDVILAVLAGALRQWLLDQDALPDQPVVAAVPVSTRGPDDLLAPGNHVSACFVHLPTQIADPRERLAATAGVADRGKAAHAAVGQQTLERMTELAYPFMLSGPSDLYQRSGLARVHPSPVNLVVSNVAGPPFDLYLAGRRATGFYALGPIFDGVALNVTALSFNGRLGVGYVTCPERLPDLAGLADAQAAAFAELADAYGV